MTVEIYTQAEVDVYFRELYEENAKTIEKLEDHERRLEAIRVYLTETRAIVDEHAGMIESNADRLSIAEVHVKTLFAKFLALSARVAALEAGEVDPTPLPPPLPDGPYVDGYHHRRAILIFAKGVFL